MLMRHISFLAVFAATIVCFYALASAAGKLPAADGYNERLKTIANRALHSALMKHRDRLNGVAMNIHYVVDRAGHVHNVKVTSRTHDTSAEKIVADTLAAITFPPIPMDAQLEVGAGYFEVQTEVNLAADDLAASKIATPAAYDYNMHVHKLLQDDLKPDFHAPNHLEVDYEFYLDREGHVTSLKTHAKAGGQSAEQIIARSIRRIKCPPIPAEVLKELDEKPPMKIYGTMSWDPSAVDQVKEICHESIGVPFQDASLPLKLAPFVSNKSELFQPVTTCEGQYCSWSVRLNEGYQVLYTFLHVQPNWETAKALEVTPDGRRKGNNRYVGVALIKDGKVIFSEGHIDSKTSNHALEPTATRRETHSR
jgi:hypothetical protein